MLCLFSLPGPFLLRVFSDWCDVKEVAFVDRALSNHIISVDFRKLLSCESFSLRNESGHSSNNFYQWVLLRNLKLCFVTLTVEEVKKGLSLIIDTTKVFKLRLNSVSWCSMKPKTVKRLTDIINSFANLQELDNHISCREDDNDLIIEPQILQNLKTLRTTNMGCDPILCNLLNCANLTYFELKRGDTELISDVCRNNPKLERVSLGVFCESETITFLQVLGSYCTGIAHIDLIVDCSDYEGYLDTISEFIAKCTSLKSLHINHVISEKEHSFSYENSIENTCVANSTKTCRKLFINNLPNVPLTEFKNFIHTIPQIHEFGFTGLDTINDEVVTEICSQHISAKKLQICGCSNVTDKCLEDVAQILKNVDLISY